MIARIVAFSSLAFFVLGVGVLAIKPHGDPEGRRMLVRILFVLGILGATLSPLFH